MFVNLCTVCYYIMGDGVHEESIIRRLMILRAHYHSDMIRVVIQVE